MDLLRFLKMQFFVSSTHALPATHARKNSRMMLAFSLHFVGPLSDVVSVEHVGVQLVEEKGVGKVGHRRRCLVGLGLGSATVSARAGIPRSTISSVCFPATTKPHSS
jgi:hypothetical protein